jgi:sugar phosphate isomerase/epimerase
VLNRRDFLGGLGAVALGGLTRSAEAARLETIGLQLYTVRRDLEKDFDGTLARVARVGFREVETAGFFGRGAAEVRASLDRHGLEAPSMHVGLSEIETGFSRTLEAAKTLGVRYVVCAWLEPEVRETLDDYRRHAATFNRAGEEAKKAGLQFGFHCHDFEFVPIEGVIPYDLLLKDTDAALVQMEMDLYWITKAGADPLHYFRQHPGRFPLVHVKDMDRTPDKGFTEVGKGIVDFRRVFAQSKLGGIRHFFVEQDETKGPAIESASESYEYLKRLEF